MPVDDIRDVLRALPNRFPPGDGYLESDIFTVRHRILRELDPQPTSVFEFGALMGYFLVTALDACPSIERVGWVDNEAHTVGSNRACCDNVLHYGQHHERTISTLTFGVSAEDVEIDERAPSWDVVSVDGDHSFDGCLADLNSAWSQLDPSIILIDDWYADTHREDIQQAAAVFLEHGAGNEYELVEEIATQNGLAVIRRKR